MADPFVWHILAWPPMIIVGIANGLLRQVLFAKPLGEQRAHQLSSLTAIVFFGTYIWLLNRWRPLESTGQALLIGGIWLFLTTGFEFLFGRYVAGHSWRELLHDYNIAKGRLWLLVLLWICIAPYLFYRLTLL